MTTDAEEPASQNEVLRFAALFSRPKRLSRWSP